MPQNNTFIPFLSPTNFQTPARLDASSNLLVNEGGTASTLNVTTATVIKASPGRLMRVNVNTAGSTTGSASDVTTTGGVAAANLIAVIPNTVGIYYLDWPCLAGITITPGTGQVLSVSYQ